MYEKPYEEKISAIRMFREEGNTFYRSKEFREAISSYQRAITYLDYAFGESEDQDHALDEERFKDFFAYLFHRGVYLSPSAYEAHFLSSAHTQAHLTYVQGLILTYLEAL